MWNDGVSWDLDTHEIVAISGPATKFASVNIYLLAWCL